MSKTKLILDRTANPAIYGDGSLKDKKTLSKGIYRQCKPVTVIYKVAVTIDSLQYCPLNDGRGGLCDIIRDGLNNPIYNYLIDVKVKDRVK